MSLSKMMAAHPQAASASEATVTAARHAMLCALFCTSCADACLAEPMDMAGCIRTCGDCADICTATARLLVRQSAANETMRRGQVEACIRACELCAAECERHDHEHCRLCAVMCRECAADCGAALN